MQVIGAVEAKLSSIRRCEMQEPAYEACSRRITEGSIMYE